LIIGLSLVQGQATITGSVRDGATNKPLALVNVYFDNTTTGSVTDELGQFVIADVPVDLSELTLSFVGYKTIKVPDLKLSDGVKLSIDVKMAPHVTSLAPITVTASRLNDWSSRYKKFRKIFLGTTPNAAKTEILNPEVLSFGDIESDTTRSKDFRARASGPLEVENRALGYHITVFLEDFQSIGPSYNIIMSTKFDTLASSSRLQSERWKKNRLDAYKGSQLHLFRSIANGIFEQEGFRILTISDDGASAIPSQLSDLVLDSARTNLKILRKGTYQISYYNKLVPFSLRRNSDDYYPTSVINVIDDHLGLYPNGQVKQPSNYWRSGYLYNFRFADLLPSDYDPIVEEGKLTLSAQRERATLKGTVIDEKGTPLSMVDVFINNGLHHTRTNAWGKFEITNLHPGKYPIAFVGKGKQPELQTINVTTENSLKVLMELKDKPEQKLPVGRVIGPELQKQNARLFWNLLFDGMGKWSFVIVNPEVLQFVRQRNEIKVSCANPIVIENRLLGYTWKYFLSDATIKRKKLKISGLVKMDTLEPQSDFERHRWTKNRADEYRGSWNHLVTSLIEGQSEADGFQFYQLEKDLGNQKPRFDKLVAANVRSIDPDSILLAKKGALLLDVPPGLEVHNSNLKPTHKFYKRQSNQVLRLTSNNNPVTISRTGSVDPGDLKIYGQPNYSISTVPLDYEVNRNNVTNKDVLLYVREENLKAVKNLLEKVYVQTDRPYYFPGDTIWFKAYLRYSNLNHADSLSNVLYAELLSPNGAVIKSLVFKIESSISWGDMVVPSSLAPDDYYLRVYTSWMRNFDEFMTRPLPIISRKNFIESSAIGSASTSPEDFKMSLSSDKPTYRTGDDIKLHFSLSKDGAPQQANFSIAVTDQSVVSELEGLPNIFSLRDPFKADSAEFIRLAYPIERGITLNGKIAQASEKSENIVTTVLMNGAATLVTPTVGPNFSITLDFVDTTTVLIQATSKHNVPALVDLLERKPVDSYHLPDPLSYRLVRDGSFVQLTGDGNEQVGVLPEVMVESTRIPNSQPAIVTSTERRYGMAFRVFEGTDLSYVRLTGNLIDFLAGKLPDFHETYYWIKTGQVFNANPATPDRGTRNEVPASVYTFLLNGILITPSDLNIINVEQVSRVEVFWLPGKKENKVAIYTESHFPHDTRNFVLYKIKGYDKPHTFYEPSKERIEPDSRPTIYWNPNLNTDENGTASISFSSSDVDGKYKITIEGITSEGEVFRATQYLNITP